MDFGSVITITSTSLVLPTAQLYTLIKNRATIIASIIANFLHFGNHAKFTNEYAYKEITCSLKKIQMACNSNILYPNPRRIKKKLFIPTNFSKGNSLSTYSQKKLLCFFFHENLL